MLDYALALAWIMGTWAFGYWLGALFQLKGSRRFALAYPLSLACGGGVGISLWIAGVNFDFLAALGWLVHLLSLGWFIYQAWLRRIPWPQLPWSDLKRTWLSSTPFSVCCSGLGCLV